MVASKAPKSRHYSKSESLDYRIAAAVSQKNMGEGNMCIVNKEAGLSVGKVAEETSNRNQVLFRKRKARSQLPKSKRRRLELNNIHFEVQKPLVVREGETYKPSIGSAPINEEDIEEIPNATFLPDIQNISNENITNAEVCIFDNILV